MLTGLASAERPTSKQLNVTKEGYNINKRYTIIPQHNPSLYRNSQVVPEQQLIGNAQAVINYINSIRTSPFGNTPIYYILPRNNYVGIYAEPNIVPQTQSNIVPAIFQGVIPQRVILQPLIPQQAVPQQTLPVTLQQVLPQQVASQKVVKQQLFRPQVIPQQVVPQQIVPRQRLQPQEVPLHLVPQQIQPQQVIRPQIVPQHHVAPQQIVPQNVIPQQTVPQHFIPQIQNSIPTIQPQRFIPQAQHTALPQQRIVPHGDIHAPLQHQFYQPPTPRTQVIVGTGPYPFEVPPSQSTIPPTKQPPTYIKVPQEYSVSRTQNLVYDPSNSISYLQGQLPQSVYVNPDGTEQVVRIGYGHPHLNQGELPHNAQERGVYNQPHHVVYVNPNLDATGINNQPVVRIGYGHPHFSQELFQDQNTGGPQQVKLPLTTPSSGLIDYRFGGNDRPARTLNVPDKDNTKQIKAESKT